MVDPVRPGVKQERLDVRVSELVAVSGVPLATVKYYLREGLLMPGAASSATQAEYGEQHVRRLALVKALAGVGLPLGRIRTIVGLVDHPADTVFETIGRALAALPPYPPRGRSGPATTRGPAPCSNVWGRCTNRRIPLSRSSNGRWRRPRTSASR